MTKLIMVETLLDKISKHSNDTIVTNAWLTGETGEIVDLKGDCIFRFIDYDTEGELRIRHTTEDSKLSCPVVACGLVGYWLHRKDSEGTKTIFDGYYELRLMEYKKAHECDDDAWERDLKKEFVCRHHVPTEKKWIKASEALFPYITDSDQKKVMSIMANYLKYANSKRIELYPEEETTQNDNSDFEHLRDYQDRSDLDYYLSEDHWNYHVNKFLYKNLLVFHEGKEVGAFLDMGSDLYSDPITDYTPFYGNIFNEVYRLCNSILTSPVPETKIAKFVNQAATWKFRNLKDENGVQIELVPNVTDLIESYHILGMVNAILCFSNIQAPEVNDFLTVLSVYNDKGKKYFNRIHRFAPYNEQYQELILTTIIDGTYLRPGYDNKRRDEYLRNNLPWYNNLAKLLDKQMQMAEEKESKNIQEQANRNCNVFNGSVTINMSSSKEEPDQATEKSDLSQLSKGPKLSTAAEKFTKHVAPYCFGDLPLVKILNGRQQAELIESMVKDACYAAAMLKYLGYYDRLRDIYQKSSNEEIIKHCAKAVGCVQSTYKKYFYSLKSKTPYNTYERHNAKAFLENGQIEKDYKRIKESK